MFTVDYPVNFVYVAESLSSLCSVDIFVFLPSTFCSFKTRTDLYYHKLASYTLGPLAIGLVILVYYLIRRCVIFGSFDMAGASTKDQRQKRKEALHDRLLQLNSTVMFTVLLFSFLIFTSVSTTIFRTFHTITFDDGSCFLVRLWNLERLIYTCMCNLTNLRRSYGLMTLLSRPTAC